MSCFLQMLLDTSDVSSKQSQCSSRSGSQDSQTFAQVSPIRKSKSEFFNGNNNAVYFVCITYSVFLFFIHLYINSIRTLLCVLYFSCIILLRVRSEDGRTETSSKKKFYSFENNIIQKS